MLGTECNHKTFAFHPLAGREHMGGCMTVPAGTFGRRRVGTSPFRTPTVKEDSICGCAKAASSRARYGERIRFLTGTVRKHLGSARSNKPPRVSCRPCGSGSGTGRTSTVETARFVARVSGRPTSTPAATVSCTARTGSTTPPPCLSTTIPVFALPKFLSPLRL